MGCSLDLQGSFNPGNCPSVPPDELRLSFRCGLLSFWFTLLFRWSLFLSSFLKCYAREVNFYRLCMFHSVFILLIWLIGSLWNFSFRSYFTWEFENITQLFSTFQCCSTFQRSWKPFLFLTFCRWPAFASSLEDYRIALTTFHSDKFVVACLHSYAGFSLSTLSLDICASLCAGKFSWISSLISFHFSIFLEFLNFVCWASGWDLCFAFFPPVFCFLVSLLCLLEDFLNFIFQPFFKKKFT